MFGALPHLVVLDLTQGVAGPFGTKYLSDYGADVIKIERPNVGDVARRMPPFKGDDPHPEKSGLFLYLNTNKRGVTLNLKDPAGVLLFQELTRQADMVVESFHPGTMERFGLGYQALSALNPRLSMISLSNFGQTGPYRDYLLTEIVSFALAGPMYTQGSPDREPLRFFENTTLHFAGVSLANCAVAAAIAAKFTGQGQYVDVSIAESFLAPTGSAAIGYFYTGQIAKRPSRSIRPQFLNGAYPCKDGYVAAQGGGRGEAWWPRVFRMMGQPELSEDPRFQNSRAIMEHGDEFDALWYTWLREHTRKEVFDAAGEARYPIAPVYTAEDIYRDPHLNDRGFFLAMEHPVAGQIRYPGPPFRLHGAPCEAGRPAPLLGQHNGEIFQGMLGLSSAELGHLKERGVI